LQPLQDTDVAGYLRVAHEQNLISTIEESRKETQEQFYRVLEERCQRDWETKKKRVFEELGGKVGGDNRALSELRSSTLQRSNLMVSDHSLSL
jgi:nuclear pore complex protein Nup93